MFKKLQSNTFIKRIGLYFAGNLSSRLLSVLLVPIYAYYVTANNLGEYDYILAMVSIISPMIYLVIWEGILRFCMMAKNLEETNIILSNIVFFSIVISILSSIFAFFIYFYFQKTDIVLYIVFMVIVQGIVSIWQYSARALGFNKQYVFSGIMGSISVVFADIFFAFFSTLDYRMLCFSYLISQIISILILEYKMKLLQKIKLQNVDLLLFRKILMFTLPLVINNVSLYLYNSGSKIIIKKYIGAYENGLYSFASKFSFIISLFSSVLALAIVEESYTYNSITEYKDKMGKIINFISKGYFSLILFALPSIYILYSIAFVNTEYYESSDYIFLLLLGALFSSLSNTIGSAFLVTDKTKYISITTISGVVFALLMSLLLVNKIGIYGVLTGNTLGTFIMMIERVFYAKKSTGLSINWKINIIIATICCLQSIGLVLVEDLSSQVIFLGVAIIFIAFFYKKELLYYIKRIKI